MSPRIETTATTGRRFPEFGVGLNDAGGYKLWLMPRLKLVLIRKGDVELAKAAQRCIISSPRFVVLPSLAWAYKASAA